MNFLPVLLLLLTFAPVRSGADMHFRFELANANAFYTSDPEEQEVLGRIAWYESAFRPEVARCGVMGDHGKSLGIYQHQPQTPRDRRAACGSLYQQTQLALATVRKSAAACPGNVGADRLAMYVAGSCRKGIPEAKHRWAILNEEAARFAKKAAEGEDESKGLAAE